MNFYHGFHQPARLDRQTLRLVFERGEVTREAWIPTRAKLRAVASETDTRRLCELFPGARLDVDEIYGAARRFCRGRNREWEVYQKLWLTWGEKRHKMHVYGEALRAFLLDQLQWIRDRDHVRRVNERHGRDALALAATADRLAIAENAPLPKLLPLSGHWACETGPGS